MDRQIKINLLSAIRSGRLPASALHIVTGVYLKTTRPGIYKDNKGHEITYDEVTRLIESGCFNVCTMAVNDLPLDSITITECSGGEAKNIEWREGRYTEITMETPDFQIQHQ